jgi:hypothetical protein
MNEILILTGQLMVIVLGLGFCGVAYKTIMPATSSFSVKGSFIFGVKAGLIATGLLITSCFLVAALWFFINS